MSSLSQPLDLSLVGVNKFLATVSGRDKLGKAVHYSARCVAGMATEAMEAAEKGSPAHAQAEYVRVQARGLFVRLMNARRTNRWLASIPIIVALSKDRYPWRSDGAFVVAQLGMVFWHVGDHVRWLQEIGWLAGETARTKRIAFSGFVVSSVVSFAYFLTELGREAKQDKVDEDKARRLRLNIVKHFLTIISTLHISELFMTSEPICGAAGAVASLIDLYTLYPRVAATSTSTNANKDK